MSDQREDAGSIADEHITGKPEEGTFLTDQAPKGNTPAAGSSNQGINERHGNREIDGIPPEETD
jgi:hypothetical protein